MSERTDINFRPEPLRAHFSLPVAANPPSRKIGGRFYLFTSQKTTRKELKRQRKRAFSRQSRIKAQSSGEDPHPRIKPPSLGLRLISLFRILINDVNVCVALAAPWSIPDQRLRAELVLLSSKHLLTHTEVAQRSSVLLRARVVITYKQIRHLIPRSDYNPPSCQQPCLHTYSGEMMLLQL